MQFNISPSEPFEIRSSLKQGCVLAPTLLGIFFALLLRHAFGVSTCEPDQTAGYSTSPSLKPRRRSAKPSPETCCLLTTQQLQLTLNRKCNLWRTASLRLARIFVWLSAWRRKNVMRQDAPSPPAITINYSKLDSVHLFKYLGSTSPWTLRSIRGSERRLQDTLASHFVCGQTPSWPWRQRWLCTMPAFLAPYSMAVRHWTHMPDRKRGSTPFK